MNILASIYLPESFTWIPLQVLYIHGHFKLRNVKLHVLMIKLTLSLGRLWSHHFFLDWRINFSFW